MQYLKIRSALRAYKMGEHDHWTISVKINGKRLWAIVDSGANSSCISPNKAEEIGLNPINPAATKIVTAEGIKSENIPNYVVEHLKLGSVDCKNRTIYGLDIPDVFEGKYQFIIGLDILKHIGSVLDIRSRTILIKE